MLIALIIFLIIGLAFFIFTYIAYRITFYSSPKNRRDIMDTPKGIEFKNKTADLDLLIKEMCDLPFEPVYITSSDGKRLFARYYHIKDGAPLHIQCHGYRGSGIRDFCGGNKLAREMGHNTLLIDQRAHGKSEGTAITFGIKERYDLLCWINYAVERFGKEIPIIISGISMGGATVLMASELELPSNVCGIIADCPYSSPEAIIKKVCKDLKLSPTLAFPFIKIGAVLYGHFNISGHSATNAVKNSKIPILIIHGEEDLFVPCDMSREIFEACPKGAIRETFADSDHGLSYVTDTERYKKITVDFVKGCLANG